MTSTKSTSEPKSDPHTLLFNEFDRYLSNHCMRGKEVEQGGIKTKIVRDKYIQSIKSKFSRSESPLRRYYGKDLDVIYWNMFMSFLETKQRDLYQQISGEIQNVLRTMNEQIQEQRGDHQNIIQLLQNISTKCDDLTARVTRLETSSPCVNTTQLLQNISTKFDDMTARVARLETPQRGNTN